VLLIYFNNIFHCYRGGIITIIVVLLVVVVAAAIIIIDIIKIQVTGTLVSTCDYWQLSL
jgi:hypothetical protein